MGSSRRGWPSRGATLGAALRGLGGALAVSLVLAGPSSASGHRGHHPAPRARHAVRWALSHRGSRAWYFHCEEFVEVAYGTAGRFPSAWAAATSLRRHFGSRTHIPLGALVFFRRAAGNGGFGHVGLSLTHGRVVSALHTVRVTHLRARRWRRLYAGWAYAPRDWPGR